MRGKKLISILAMAGLIASGSRTAVYAEELADNLTAEVTTESEQTVSDEEAVSETDAAPETGSENSAEAVETEEEELLTTEVSNVTNTLMNALSQSVAATITLEQAKLPKYSEEDLMYLACIIYCEAGNQEFEGMVAVANVVMNRAKSEDFDHVTTIKEAIYDCERWGRQFSPVYVKSNGKWTTKGSNYEKAIKMYQTGVYPKDWQKPQMDACITAAKAALEGKVVLDEEYLYFNMGIASTKSKCKKQGRSYQVIGCHIFY